MVTGHCQTLFANREHSAESTKIYSKLSQGNVVYRKIDYNSTTNVLPLELPKGDLGLTASV